MSSENQKPALTLTDGNIKATIWKQQGPNGSFYSAAFSKTYRDEQGNYHNSHSFAGTDLLKVSQLAQQAYQRSRELRYQDRQNAPVEPAKEQQHDRER